MSINEGSSHINREVLLWNVAAVVLPYVLFREVDVLNEIVIKVRAVGKFNVLNEVHLFEACLNRLYFTRTLRPDFDLLPRYRI